MTPKQKIFCDEYLICNNATEAALKAGYSKKTAYSQGQRLLKNVECSKFLEEKKKRLEIKTEITQERILQEYARIAFFDPRKLFDENGNLKRIIDLDEDTAAVIAGMDISAIYKKGLSQDEIITEVTKKLKHVDKKGALDSLARINGMFVEKIDIRNKTVEDYLLERMQK